MLRRVLFQKKLDKNLTLRIERPKYFSFFIKDLSEKHQN